MTVELGWFLEIEMDVLDNLKSLERQSEDRIWRTAKAAGEEINRLRNGVTAYLKANDTEGFGCACTPKFKCYPCREHDRQKPLRELLTPNAALKGGASAPSALSAVLGAGG